jgi:hypothetical protein
MSSRREGKKGLRKDMIIAHVQGLRKQYQGEMLTNVLLATIAIGVATLEDAIDELIDLQVGARSPSDAAAPTDVIGRGVDPHAETVPEDADSEAPRE